MKKGLVVLFILGLMACKDTKPPTREDLLAEIEQQEVDGIEVDPAELPIMTFKEDRYNFGNIKKGDKVTHNFEFTNTGKTPLIIKDAQGTCGCTIPTYSKEPILPGKSGVIEVNFDSSNFEGVKNKSVKLVVNTVNKVEWLKITANIQK